MDQGTELVNINCPVCGTPIVTAYKEKNVEGTLMHKCANCKRFWNVDYTNKTIDWAKGKESSTPIKNWELKI